MPLWRAHPRDELGQQQRRHELALVVARGGRWRRSRRRACRRATAAGAMSSGGALGPRRERRRRQQAVEPQGERRCGRLGGKKVSRSNTPSLRSGGCLHLADERGQVEAAPWLHDVSMRLASRMCSRDDSGIGVDADQAEQARRRSPRSRRAWSRCRSVSAGAWSEPTRFSGHAGRGARGVDREAHAVARGAGRRSVPMPQPARPSRQVVACCSANSSGVTPAFWASPSLIQGRKSAGAGSGNSRQRLARSPLGSMSRHGHAGREALLDAARCRGRSCPNRSCRRSRRGW